MRSEMATSNKRTADGTSTSSEQDSSELFLFDDTTWLNPRFTIYAKRATQQYAAAPFIVPVTTASHYYATTEPNPKRFGAGAATPRSLNETVVYCKWGQREGLTFTKRVLSTCLRCFSEPTSSNVVPGRSQSRRRRLPSHDPAAFFRLKADCCSPYSGRSSIWRRARHNIRLLSPQFRRHDPRTSRASSILAKSSGLWKTFLGHVHTHIHTLIACCILSGVTLIRMDQRQLRSYFPTHKLYALTHKATMVHFPKHELRDQ